MLGKKHLSLQSLRLNGEGDWKYTHEGLVFLFVKSGAGSYTDARSTLHLGPGDILSLNGEAKGTLAAVSGGDLVFLAFSLKFEHFLPLFAGEEIALLKQVMESLKTPKLIPSRHPLSGRCQEMIGGLPAQFNLDHRTQLLRVAGLLLSEEFSKGKQQRSGFIRVEDHMVQVFESLSAEELLNLSVGEMAQRFSCSRRHLNRLFHQYFGFSVASIRMEMRLLKAVSLLRDPDIKVIDVAERCGFNHLGLFNGCFRRRFNASPGQWRKMNTQALAEPKSDRDYEQDRSCPLQSQGLCPWMGDHHGVSPIKAVKEKLKTPLKALGFECAPEPVHSKKKSGAPARNRGRKPLDTSKFEIGK